MLIQNHRNHIAFTLRSFSFFAGYPYVYLLDLYVVLYAAGHTGVLGATIAEIVTWGIFNQFVCWANNRINNA